MRPDVASPPAGAADVTSRSVSASEEQDDSRSTSSTASPAPPDNEESDFFLNNNDSQSSLGVPNFQDMAVDDACWPPVNRLPNEILIGIFSKLSAPTDLYHSMLVCKRWARNSVDLLWHRPSCTNWKNHSSICQTLGLEKPFFSYRDFIRRLNLAALADKVNDGSVMPLAVCSRVERLTLTNCKNLTDSGLIALVQGSSSLLALDISQDKNITEESIKAIADNCKRLQGLNISGCDNVSNSSLVKLAQSCKYIKRLKLNECVQVHDDAIFAFADNCSNILEIDLHQCGQVGNGPITSLISKGNCLRELRLASCDLIDDHAFLSLPSGRTFEHLRILDLTSCSRLTDVAVQKIVEAAPRLRNLVLAKCRNITDASVYAISKLGKNLHYVHLGHCSHITDDGVKKLVNNCNRIRYIDLGCCVNLTDDSVRRLAMLPKLKRIGLVKCSSITDESVLALADAAFRPRARRDGHGMPISGEYYASSLERVHLSYCLNLTLKSILRLLNSCPRLTHLSLTGVAAFQRDDFQPFCRHAPPEFTQQQRDLFCVFSGNMVSQFRHYLNTNSQFDELRDGHSGDSRRARNRPQHPPADILGDTEGIDDEMGDEDPDYDVLDAHQLGGPIYPTLLAGMDATTQATAQMPPFLQAIPVPPGGPHAGSHAIQPFAADSTHFGPTAFSSFLNSQPVNGAPPPSAHGLSLASVATAAGSTGGPAHGASTASMHQQHQQLGEEDTPGQQDQARPSD
ncbi:F-box and leucine-rich repeat protein GRR1 [Geosmithia morbida]|uniref:F-box and leucine-rich repeat protein GRR1 n=1 Tax=Geosmithia morbida TaxID=1094350 RepID=A0A9P5CZT0_9HYPO|nr:F-box and leucine-rich repeat protein GRR1 [Geosmithia morbida]KAF4121938.1 F-box and leucine-rich repeat protein GRR1 [Geosmithia morbida]